MSPRFTFLVPPLAVAMATIACGTNGIRPQGDSKLSLPGETHLKNIRQLTFEGTNAEAYWSFDGKRLSFQRKSTGSQGPACDQIYWMYADGSGLTRVSGGGRTTCSFFFPDDSRILYSSTFQSGAECPPTPDLSHGYVWPIYNTYQLYSSKPDGRDTFSLEPGEPRAYNAETTVCRDGSVVFTSDRDGDLDLYTAKLDPLGTLSDVKRITTMLGYDGGAFFSADCKKLVWRASRPRPGKETEDYEALLGRHLVRPTELEIWMADADGSHPRQVTRLGAASFAPFFAPDGKKIIFASNPRDPHGRHFDLYLINTNGTGLERVTYSDTFESFPMFSPDGKYLAFSSNRNAAHPHETNVFVADWVADASARRPDPLSAEADPADRFLAIVQRLSAPEMEGRGVTTSGIKRALNFTESRFRAAGLKPFFETFGHAQGMTGYRQDVKVKFHSGNILKVVDSQNLLGTWGNACGHARPVVIGAHLDHLGYGGEGSLERKPGRIHPGADDNASGVAGMLEAAGILATDHELERSSCFIISAFTGEEIGIAGSSRFVDLLKSIHILPKAMLNLDMVGRMDRNRLIVFGTDSAREWKGIVKKECEQRRLSCPGGGDGYGPSDHMSFYLDHVPVLHFFTGPHADYHRSTDTADKINATGGVQAAEVVAAVAARAASPAQPLHYMKTRSAPLMGHLLGRQSHGAYLGTIPDYSSLSSPHGPGGGSADGGGVPLAGTRAGSPADQAGVKEGDVLVSIDAADGSHPIATLDDFMNVLVQLRPGDKIMLGVKRGDTLLHMPALVGKRE